MFAYFEGLQKNQFVIFCVMFDLEQFYLKKLSMQFRVNAQSTFKENQQLKIINFQKENQGYFHPFSSEEG